MTTYIMIYEGFVNFEIVLSMHLLKTAGEVKTVGVDDKWCKSAEGLTVVPDMTMDQVSFGEEDVFIIPGGNPAVLDGNEAFYKLIRQANDKEICLGAICAAPIHLAKAGVLADREYTTSLNVQEVEGFNADMYVHQNVVVDEHIVTAQPTGYAEFAIVLGQIMAIYESKEDLEETVKFFMDMEIM